MKTNGTTSAGTSVGNTPAPDEARQACRHAPEGGATIAELSAGAGWQTHSVRGAMAGALKKHGHAIVSEKLDGVRRYRIEPTA